MGDRDGFRLRARACLPLVRALALLLLLAALVVAGCSGDDTSSTTTETVVTTTEGAGSGDFDRIPSIVDRVQPSVVSVVTDAGQGSGVVYGDEGFVITNDHVVGSAPRIAVVLANGKRLGAELRGSTDRYDIAVLEVEDEGLPTATFAGALPEVGALAIAIGNPIGFESSVTQGIVSGLHREIPAGGTTPALVDLIQTDAAISPGNSGGALVDGDGEVIGINVAYLPPQSGAVALGFAIPAPVAVSVADQLIESGEVELAYLGIVPVQVTPELNQAFDLGSDTGMLVEQVVEDGPAAKVGIRQGDVIVQLDDRELELVEDLFAELREHKPGEQVEVTVVRDGERRAFDVTLGEAGAS